MEQLLEKGNLMSKQELQWVPEANCMLNRTEFTFCRSFCGLSQRM
jgi:hypothetical protein